MSTPNKEAIAAAEKFEEWDDTERLNWLDENMDDIPAILREGSGALRDVIDAAHNASLKR
jgi:hypothetical protein